jgi:hypothetical protein
VGLFDFLKKKKPAAAEPPAESVEEAEEVESPVSAVVVLRAGMSSPDETYTQQLLADHFPEALARGLPITRLSQPRWFKPGTLDGGLRLLARAMAAETQTDAGAATWITCSGPDGAPAAIVLLRA